jgi:hypothetical protein
MLVGLEPLLMESEGNDGVRAEAMNNAISQGAAMVEALAEELMQDPRPTQPGHGVSASRYAVGSQSSSAPPPTG